MKVASTCVEILLSCILGAVTQAATSGETLPQDNPYPAASHIPDSQPGWERFQTAVDPDAPFDEAMGGKTARGTPISKRNLECFPAENRNVFFEMDEVATGKPGVLQPFAYGDEKGVTDEGRNAIRGQNTWVLWGDGNEAFWGWLQERGYGLTDFLVLLDSRARDTRFGRTGMLNQPGMKKATHQILGLWLDEGVDGGAITLRPPETDKDAKTGKRAEQTVPPSNHFTELFKPGDAALYAKVLNALPKDGVDYTVYGYPSGVVGLRLFPSPDFFGATPAAAAARTRWRERVEDSGNKYYTDYNYQADPTLVRPFRVSMSCGFCHVGPHPLNPPPDPEHPEWKNLSSTIGNQYWSPPHIFANLTKENSLLYHYLASQQPGTIDTSLVSTDHINNANTITAVFDINARLARAAQNPPEDQSPANLLVPVINNGDPRVAPRQTPRVLLDGADSIGAFGALSRVYLNIGTAPEQWARDHNPIIGYKPQRPFSVATLKDRSVYWQTAEKYRIPYLAAFFTHKSPKTELSIVAPMKLASTVEGAKIVAEPQQRELARQGRNVFLDNCAICHSSKQPQDLRLNFSDDWSHKPVPTESQAPEFTLPMHFEDWSAFRKSGMLAEYRRRIERVAGQPAGDNDEFLVDNFLSVEVRVPITLVGTNSGRSVGTNGMRGQVWDNFSSDTYKSLPAVGRVRFYNPYLPATAPLDNWGNNDQYYPPGGGPGYYRPASLISVWATAPYLHNNALGLYNHDPSIAGRLAGFNDGIDKLLLLKPRWQPGAQGGAGDLRGERAGLAGRDTGFIYRITEDSRIAFAAPFIRLIVEGIVGPLGTCVITFWLWAGLTALWFGLLLWGRARIAAFTLLLFAVLSASLLVITRFDLLWPSLWFVPVLSAGTAVAIWVTGEHRVLARALFAVFAAVTIVLGYLVHGFVNGERGGIDLGPIPKGTPINLIMNLNPEAPTIRLIKAISGLTRGMVLSARYHNDPEAALRVFEEQAGSALLGASKCPDFVLDRGHWFAEDLTKEEKTQLKAFLLTL